MSDRPTRVVNAKVMRYVWDTGWSGGSAYQLAVAGPGVAALHRLPTAGACAANEPAALHFWPPGSEF